MPFLNPVNWVKVSPDQIPQYNSRWMDDYFWKNRLNEFQKAAKQFYQLWQTNDVISVQLENNGGQISIETRNCKGQLVGSPYIMQQKQQNTFDPSYFLYEAHMSQGLVPPGVYFHIARVGVSPVTDVLISEPFSIATKHAATILLQYKNRIHKAGMIFETGIEPWLRVKAYLEMIDPESEDVTFEDQISDIVTLKSTPYRVFRLHIEQIPDWLINILNYVLGCSSVRLDGVYFSKNSDAKIEGKNPANNNALKNYTVDLRESKNTEGKIFDSDVVSSDEITLSVNTTSKGFADTSQDASSSVVTFLDIN